jgi:hypothetical protein
VSSYFVCHTVLYLYPLGFSSPYNRFEVSVDIDLMDVVMSFVTPWTATLVRRWVSEGWNKTSNQATYAINVTAVLGESELGSTTNKKSSGMLNTYIVIITLFRGRGCSDYLSRGEASETWRVFHLVGFTQPFQWHRLAPTCFTWMLRIRVNLSSGWGAWVPLPPLLSLSFALFDGVIWNHLPQPRL